MRAGKLRHILEVQRPAENRGEAGSAKPEYTTFATVHAAIEPLRGEEAVEARKVDARVTHRVRLRYLPGFTAKHRLVAGGRVFCPVSVLDVDERHREMEVLAREQAD